MDPKEYALNRGDGARQDVLDIYTRLYDRFGPQRWWPGESPFEVLVGAILTQRTSWKNVEKALIPLRKRRLLTPGALNRIPEKELARLIRPCGFFNVKAGRLKALARFIFKRYGGSLDRMFLENEDILREQLLHIKGIGPETADSILLYAGNLPYFVVDGYTRRIFSRHRLIHETDPYHEVQNFFISRLPLKHEIFNEYHALIVKTGKVYCKTEANCEDCPLRDLMVSPLDKGRKNVSLNDGRSWPVYGNSR